MLKRVSRRLFIILLILVLISVFYYLTVRLFLMISSSFFWYDKLIGYLLLFAEFFLILHSIGFMTQVLKIFLAYQIPEEDRPLIPQLNTNPYVAILIPSYNEPLKIVEATIIGSYNLTYKNKHIFLLDDTRYDLLEDNNYKMEVEDLCKKFKINLFRRKWRGAKAGIINDYLDFVSGVKNEDFVFFSYEDIKIDAKEVPKYIAIFDADQNPYPNFLEPLVALSEDDKKIAFVQTPQYYTNFEENRIAEAAALQQVIFYEYVCSGKGISESIFCCGSNVLLRVEAIKDVGGFDETTVTEDIALSLSMHLKGWTSKYYNKVGVFGLSPGDLGNYFKQQFRWALGGISLFKKLIISFIKNPRGLSLIKWWEYFLSTTFYLSSIMYLTLWLCPILYLIFDVPSFFASPFIYAAFLLPYFILTTIMFYWSLRKRNYRILNIMRGQFLFWISFPVYIKAAYYAFMGKRKRFEVTSKLSNGEYPYFKLLFQILFVLLCFVSIIWGVNRIYYERYNFWGIAINIFWTSYNLFVMSSTFYFNEPKEQINKSMNYEKI